MFPRVVCWEEKADRLCAGGHVHVSQEGFHCDVAAACAAIVKSVSLLANATFLVCLLATSWKRQLLSHRLRPVAGCGFSGL